jgi:1-acyl-sn-glycerol-3-phosphate acyltransferase
MMRTVAVWLYQIYAWLIFFPLVILLTLIASALTILCATLISPKWASAIVPPAWGRVLTYLTPVRVIVEGGEHANRGQSYVVTINHQSMYDIIIVYGWLKLDLKWVIKKELRKMPGIGLGCEKAGHIFVDRRKPKQAAKAIRDALSRLGDGVGVLFFPEGTRSMDGRLLSLKSGAFRLAKEQGLPVLPVTLVGTRDILPAQSLRVFPGSVRMVIHPPISPEGKAIDELVEETRQAIASALPRELR